MSDLVVRKAEAEDVEAIENLEKQCFATPWSYDSLYKDIVENKLALYIVAEVDGELAGYAGVWRIVDEGHITNVAVAPEHRRQHLASIILATMFDVTAEEGIKKYTLEVRAGNTGAIKLYEGLGFSAEGIRPGYYEDNGEDAVLMWR